MNRHLIVFDFDGVISNSIHDSFVTALNTYMEFEPEYQLPLTGPIDPAERIFQFEKNYPEIFHHFQNLLPMGNRAEDYFVILKCIHDGKAETIQNEAQYEQFKNSIDIKKLDDYHALFYKIRAARQQADPEAWCRLLPPFEPVLDAIKQFSKSCDLAIATSKDHTSVVMQLEDYGLRSFFPEDRILDKDFSHSKHDHLVKFHQEHGTPYNTMHFIDDKVLHLCSVKSLGVRCYLAAWGFNTEREEAIAKAEGFTIVTLNALKDTFSPSFISSD